MFKALEASGIRGFLGCSSTLYERELEQFFDKAIVQEGDITCAVSGKYVSISESRFAGVFGLPTEGLTDISAVPKDLVYNARIIFSQSGEPVSFYCKKRLLKYEYRLLNDILAKSLTVKAGSFDAEMVDKTIKRDKGFAAQICVFLKGDPAVTLGDATTFPQLKILSAKTVSTYVATNKTIDSRGETVEPGTAPTDADDEPVEVVAEKAGSRKRPAITGDAPAVKKNKRTTKGNTAHSTENLELVSASKEVVHIHMIAPTSVVPAEQPPVPKRRAPKRKFRMPASSDDEIVEKRAAVEETAEMDTEEVFVETTIDGISDVTAEAIGTDIVMGAVDIAEPEFKLLSALAVTDEEVLEPLSKVLETTVSPISDDESLTIEEHLAQMPEGMMLPSLTSGEPTKNKFCNEIEIRGVEDDDWYRAHIPKIAATDKGKKFLAEPDTKVITEMTSLFHSFSLRNLKAMRSVKEILSKEDKMLAWAETDSLETAIQRRLLIIARHIEVLLRKALEARRTNIVPDLPTTAIDQRNLDLLSAAHQQAVRNLLRQMRARGLKWTRPVSSMLF
ncbi:elongation factor 1-delta-like [Dorcoceras hygrometricum]|uniref:Elongation factor 1-delta-like n=1 Tax=Dorcoceras hygrometricum TaxID=472368 RepID=A0A2Z7BRT8_9LAMI|nr:elongation factor 1-delta-like [Dorcoceras hygrometricum]